VAARLATRRGEWGEALRLYDAALAGPSEDEVGLWLGKLDARLALYQYREFREEVATLAARSDLGQHAGTVRLLQGYGGLMRARKGDEDPLVPIREALKLGLPPAEKEFAEALLAPTVPEVIDHLYKALEADPLHRRSLDVLPSLLFLTGRLPEMREVVVRLRGVAPEAPGSHAYTAFLLAVDGKLDDARREADRARPTLGADGVQMVDVVVRVLHLTAGPETLWKDRPRELVWLVVEYLMMGPKLARLTGEPEDGKAPALGEMSLFQLPCFGGADVLMVDSSLLWQLLGLQWQTALGDRLERFSRRAPSGNLFLARGLLLHRAGKLAEAEAALQKAVVTPSFVDCRRRALFELLNVRMNKLNAPAATVERQPGAPVGKPSAWEKYLKLQEVCRQDLRKLAAWGEYPPWALGVLAMHARSLGEPGVALHLAQAWARQAPDDRNALTELYLAETSLGAHDQAAATALRLTQKQPGDVWPLVALAQAELTRGNLAAAFSRFLDAERLGARDEVLKGDLMMLEWRLKQKRRELPGAEALLQKLRLRQALLKARAGDGAGAAEAAAASIPEKAPSPAAQVALACVFARAASATWRDEKVPGPVRAKAAERLVCRAMERLEAARAAGLFAEPDWVGYVLSDEDLFFLRGRLAFHRLLRAPAPVKRAAHE
jgi:hypothetical protein